MAALTASRPRAGTGRVFIPLLRSRRLGRALRLALGAAVLVAVVVRVGAGPFLHGLLSLDVPTVVAAVVLCAVATAAAAWRWRLVAVRLGAELRWTTAVGMYYRSQFVNTVLPGGVVGDVQRAVDHGRDTDRRGAAARAVAVERTAGQVVQLVLSVVLLLVLGPEFTGLLVPVIGIGVVVVVLAVGVAALASTRARRALRHEAGELRAGLGSVSTAAQVVAASVLVVACHAATFAIAAVAVGAQAPPPRMLALALVVLLAASLPLSVGGWGPREGVAGWAFAVAGLGAATGVSAATLFGVLAIVSVLPGVLAFRVAPWAASRVAASRVAASRIAASRIAPGALAAASRISSLVASLGSGRNHARHPLRDPQLRRLAGRLPRHRGPAAADAVERGRLRPGG